MLAAKDDRLSRWRYEPERAFPSHVEALAYVRSIWKCLIRLLYGRPKFVIPPHKASTAKQVVFIANLYAYAELLGLSDHLLKRICNALRSIPDFWKLVSQEPDIFIDLAYYMYMPDVYMDAMKRWISSHPSGNDLAKWHRPGSERSSDL
jgi:hypothetical protein